MNVQINPQDRFTLTEALEQHLDHTLEAVDRRFGTRLTRLEVYLSDVNGPKGGPDKECKLEARPRGMDPVVASSTNEDAYMAIKEAADKLIKALEHRIGKANSRH